MSHSAAGILLDALTFAALVALGLSLCPLPRKPRPTSGRKDGQKP